MGGSICSQARMVRLHDTATAGAPSGASLASVLALTVPSGADGISPRMRWTGRLELRWFSAVATRMDHG
jgi:hypothetical protein